MNFFTGEMTLNFEIDKLIGMNLHADPTRNKYPIYLNYTQIVPDICHIVMDVKKILKKFFAKKF